MYGNEGYLTNTLPVKTYQLILIKFLNFWFWIFIGFVVIVISGILLFFNSFMIYDILQIFIEARYYENYLFIILSQIISVSSTIMLLFLCVAIANIFKSYKLIIGIISYFIINSILAVLNYLIIFIPYIFFLGNDFLEGSTSIYSISVISIFINIIEMIIMFFTILYIHRNYLNLE